MQNSAKYFVLFYYYFVLINLVSTFILNLTQVNHASPM